MYSQTQAELVGALWDESTKVVIVQSFHADEPMGVALRHVWGEEAQTASLFITEHQPFEDWQTNPALVDVRSEGPQTVTFQASALGYFPVEIEGLTGLATATGDRSGHAYDVILDLDGDGTLSEGDVMDGGSQPGFYLLGNLNEAGNHEVVQVEYAPSFWHTQRIFYPADVTNMPSQPLVVISHGWTHEYTYYDYLGHHLASYGYIVMSHRNNVGSGNAAATETASQTALENIDVFLSDVGVLAGGVLEGRVDPHRIVHMGHSTGGECVVRARNRLVEGSYVSQWITAEDIVLINSFAPVSFLPAEEVSPLDVAFHEFFGGADTDVSGDAVDGYVQGLAIFERATGNRSVTYIHGAGHEDLHGNPGPSWADGPDLIGREATHSVTRPYTLALCELHAWSNRAVEEYFSRPRMQFGPLGMEEGVTVTGEHRPSWPEATGGTGGQGGLGGSTVSLVLDDHQTQPSPSTSSAGTMVTSTGLEAHEVLMRDMDESFDWTGDNWANGMVRSRFDDEPRCVVLAWEQPSSHCLQVPSDACDWTDADALVFRAAQLTRHPWNDGPLSFEVQLSDGAGHSWNFSTAALGEVLPPYPRSRGGSYTACLVSGTYTLEVGGSTWPEEQFVTITDHLEYVGSGTYPFTVDTSEPCDTIEILCFDTWGDGWDSGTFEIQNDAGELVLEGTLSTGSFPDPGAGWQNEFHSFSIPLDQTAVDASPLDLSHVVEVCFQLGGVGHSTTGSMALDDVALISSGQGQTTDLEFNTQTSPDMGWAVFPNPATSLARVQPPDPTKPWQIEVWDLQGRSIWRQSGSYGVAILPVQTWQPGGYVVRLEQEGASTPTILMVH